MKVRWSKPAYDDLENIFRHLSKDNPAAAREVVKAIYDSCTTLQSLPSRGRAGRMNGRRELVFTSLPYIAVYRVTNDAVEISRIFHSAQDWL
jgi:toxin ParE1/3/4